MKKTALITGATSGIGRATAHEFAKYGIRLILCGRRLERLQIIQKALSKQTDVQILNFDVRDKQAFMEAKASLPAVFKEIAILLNNAENLHGLVQVHTEILEDCVPLLDIIVKGLFVVSK